MRELAPAKDVEALRGFKLNGVIRAANSFPPHALVLASSEPWNGGCIAQAARSNRAPRRGRTSQLWKLARRYV